MSKRKLLPVLLAVFLAISFTGKVDAGGDVFLIEPKREVIKNIELTVSDKTSANVSGSVSVTKGFIDFYITSPSGIVLLCYNKTAFKRFNFAAKENGTYVIHLVNTWSANNVTATLNYGVNRKITLQEKINAKSSTDVTIEPVLVTPSPIDILEILQIVYLAVMIVSGILSIFGVKLYVRRKKKVPYIRKFGIIKGDGLG